MKHLYLWTCVFVWRCVRKVCLRLSVWCVFLRLLTRCVSVFCVVSRQRVVLSTASKLKSPGRWGRPGRLPGKCPTLIHSHTHSLTYSFIQTVYSLGKTKSKSLCLCFTTGRKKEQQWPPPTPLLHHWREPPASPQRIIPSNRNVSYFFMNLEYSRYTSIVMEED